MKKAKYKFTETASHTEALIFLFVALLLLASLITLIFRNQVHTNSSKSLLAPAVVEQLED